MCGLSSADGTSCSHATAPPTGTHDTQGVSTDDRLSSVLDAALTAGITIAFHLEPYAGREVHAALAPLATVTTAGDSRHLMRALLAAPAPLVTFARWRQ